FFHFMDLPDGAYTLTFSLALTGAGARVGKAEKAFSVTRDGAGRIAAGVVIVELTPTGAQGRVLGGPRAPLAMARGRVPGGGGGPSGGAGGGFSLPRLEPGRRSIAIAAPGFQEATITVTLVEGAMASLGDTTLRAGS